MTAEEEKQQAKKEKTEAQKERQRRKNFRQRRNRIINLYNEVSGRCVYCGKYMWCKQLGESGPRSDMATMEHIIPLARKGSARSRNNQTCSCYDCNRLRKALPHIFFKFIVMVGLKNWVDPTRRFKWKYWNVYMRRIMRLYRYFKNLRL